MQLKASALFTHDARGRIVGSNEPEPERAPRLFLGRTRAGNVWRFRDDLPDEMVTRLEGILAGEPPLDNPQARPMTFEALRAALAAEASVSEVWEGPAWTVPESVPVADGVVAIGPENAALLREHYPWTSEHVAALWPCYAVVEDGHAVAICFSSRLTPEAAEAGVDTVEAYRGRGFAPRVVSAWAAALHASGRAPIYSTSWDNLASQAVARKLGLVFFGAEMSLT